jgi:hypothetical protein
MAEVSVIEASQVNDFKFKRLEPAVRMKRKTPSELRVIFFCVNFTNLLS